MLVICISSVILLLLCHCKSTQLSAQSPTLEQVIREKVGGEASTESNKTDTYILAKEAPDTSGTGSHACKFVVIRKKDHAVMVEGKYSNGYVKWVTDNSIEVLSVPGKVQWNQDLSPYKRQIIIEGIKP